MGLHPMARRRLRLLYVGDAALARECLGRPGGSIEVLDTTQLSDGAFAPISPGGSLPFDILLVEHGHPGVDALAILTNLTSRRLHVPVVIVAEWDEDLAVAVLKLGASDYVARSRASLRAVYFRLHRLMAHAALLAEQSSAPDAGRAALEQQESARDELLPRLLELQALRDEAEHRFNDAVTALKQARADRFADAVTAARELAQRESDFAAKLRAAEAVTRSLEQQVADRNAALESVEERAATDRIALQDAACRTNELETVVNRESARCRTLDADLELATEALRVAEQRRLAEAAGFADRLAQYHAEVAANAAQITRQRDAAEQRLTEAISALEQARVDRAADAVTAADHLATREAEQLSELRDTAIARDRLQQRLIDADTALRCAEQRVTAEQHAGHQRIAEHQAEFQAELSRQSGIRDLLRQQLAETRRAVQQAEDRRASDELLSAERLAAQQTAHTVELSAAAEAHDALQGRLASVEAALREATEHHAAEMAEAAARLADEQTVHAARMSEAAAAQDALQSRLASVEAALREATERHAAEMGDATARLADEQTAHTARVSEAAAAQDALQGRLASVEAALRDATERHAVEMAEAVARSIESREEADARSAQAAAAIMVVESKLAESEAQRQRAEEVHAAALGDAADRLAEHEQATATWLSEAAVFANALETGLADTVRTLRQVEEQAAADRQAAIEAGSQQQAVFDGQLTEAEARYQELSGRLQIAEAARQADRERHSLEMSEAAAHLAENQRKADSRLAQADTAIKVAESKRAESLAALDRVVRQASAERQAASADARQRQMNFDGSLREEIGRRQAIEKDLYAARIGAEEARLQFVNELAAATERGLEAEARLLAQAAEERAAWEAARLRAEEEIEHLQKEGDRLHQSLVAAVQQIRRLESAQQEERSEAERTRLAIEADLARQHEDSAALRRSLNETRTTSAETLQRLAAEASSERARLEALVADRESAIDEQAVRARASADSAAAALADVDERLHLSIEVRNRESAALADLQNRLESTARELEATRSQREALRTTAGQVPVLQEQLDTIRAASRREFDDLQVNRFRCLRSGAITRVNGALAGMLGYETPGELRKLDFREAVFESGDELQWLVDRCLSSRACESIDTTWKKKDGSRTIVRVMAVATGGDSIDLVVEDITPLRTLEDRLHSAQRMEAVARYGSEVAVTCHTLLTHVKQEGQQWLARMENDVARYQGQLLFDDVTRAAGLMGQFAAYGEEQRNAPEVVDVTKVLRDLAPVLKRVAGEDIDVVLPKVMAPLTLDVDARPVERMLVNVAAYGRERMPLGGRLMINVDSVVVDRDFVAKYPNVRPGAHVLLTVNEVRSSVRPELAATARTRSSDVRQTTGNLGVDLGTLQALVNDCGGHLWMKAEPPGDMVLKIHLPRRVLDRAQSPTPVEPNRPRWFQRAFGARH